MSEASNESAPCDFRAAVPNCSGGSRDVNLTRLRRLHSIEFMRKDRE